MRRKVQSADEPTAPTYQLKIVLADVSPAVWRRVLVRGDANLGLLHAIIQVTLGWTNSHLHQFLVGDKYYSDPGFRLDEYSPQAPINDENRVTLLDAAPHKGDVFWYEYDFGDSWYHGIRVEKIQPADPAWKVFAECTGGARACPPENAGGPFGYEDILDARKHPNREDYQDLVEWLGPSFDPNALEPSPDKVNKYLRKLTWPRTTVAELAGVLMQRDGVKVQKTSSGGAVKRSGRRSRRKPPAARRG